MTKKEKLENLYHHIQNNPADYQAVISFFKLRSKQIEYERKRARIDGIRLIAECRRKLNEKHVSE